MKTIPHYGFSLMLSFLLIMACEKEDVGHQNNALIGTWKLQSYYYSIGGPLIYKSAVQNVVLKFNGNGSMKHPDPDIVRYKTDSNTVFFLKKDSTKLTYSYRIDKETLNLSPEGENQCIEGCGEIYTRIN